ncbi:hypothetical protein INT45_008639 [Circinella minor]|uniref:Uncharacterized protein n=1 Tax=Circinella minor TaxID=1195481 RepID=A0A8H7S2T0_9FUNG|nr:hypothetical protein INT45_008639 [Circinella minor]
MFVYVKQQNEDVNEAVTEHTTQVDKTEIEARGIVDPNTPLETDSSGDDDGAEEEKDDTEENPDDNDGVQETLN